MADPASLVNELAKLADDSLLRPVGLILESSKLNFVRMESKGFSDTEIYKLTNSFGSFAVRSWRHSPESRWKVDFWHDLNHSFQEAVEDSLGVVLPFPRLHRWLGSGNRNDFMVALDDRWWTLCDWVPGRPIQRCDVDWTLIRHLGTVLGAIHRRTHNLARDPSTPKKNERERSPSIDDRIYFAERIQPERLLRSSKHPTLRSMSVYDPVCQCVESVIANHRAWIYFLKAFQLEKRDRHWIVRDLWHENVLLDNRGRFSSIVDLGAARNDWPGLDFARLFGSLIGILEPRSVNEPRNLAQPSSSANDPVELAWKEAYVAYIEQHPDHSIESLEECQMISHVSCGLSIVQWLYWIADEVFAVQDFGVRERIANRIRELCTQYVQRQLA